MTHRSVLVTGASAGIGRATVLRFLAMGWQVGAIDRDGRALAALEAEAASERLWTEAVDVTDADAYTAALRGFMEGTGGRLDVLVNNAGLVCAGDFESIDCTYYDRLIDVNVKAVVRGCHIALPFLMTTPGARVVNLCSASAAYGVPSYAVYSASKFAVRGLTEALDAEWRRHGIRVTAVWPLFTRTAMTAGIHQPAILERLGVRLDADDVARVVTRSATCPRWWPQVHWNVGLQGLLVVLTTRFLPAWLNRIFMRELGDY